MSPGSSIMVVWYVSPPSPSVSNRPILSSSRAKSETMRGVEGWGGAWRGLEVDEDGGHT